MKGESCHHACPNGNDCASPPIRNNAQGKNRQRGQQGDFDKCFHRRKYAPALARFPARWLAAIKLTYDASRHMTPTECPSERVLPDDELILGLPFASSHCSSIAMASWSGR
jgi:hypothetical protein